MKRVAISQRVVENDSYEERRDALDQRWVPYCQSAGLLAIPMPNVGKDILNWLTEINIQGLILSGGNNLVALSKPDEAAPERDETEETAVSYCENNGLPVLGVCRGCQLLLHLSGVALLEVSGHVNQRHSLYQESDLFPDEVNSFHNFAAQCTELPENIQLLASTNNEHLEAFADPAKKHLGIMWHPEREDSPIEKDILLFKSHFGAK